MTRNLLLGTLSAAALSFGVAHAQTITINAGGSSLAYPTYETLFQKYTASNSSVLFSYGAVGSGAGQNGFLNNNVGYYEPYGTGPGQSTLGSKTSFLSYGTIVGTTVDIGASDAYLSSSQVSSTGTYGTAPNGSAADGPLIQLPTLGVPVTIAFNPPTGYTIKSLNLTDAQLCGIFSGQITDWNTIDSAIPKGKAAFTIVYRTDGSGTTFLFSQHLDTVCTTGAGGNSNFAPGSLSAPTKLFVTLFNSTTNPIPASADGEGGSGNVAQDTGNGKGLLNIPGSIGYLSPDYTSIAPKSPNTTKLQVASLYNSVSKAYYTPSVSNTITALENPGNGSTFPTAPSTKATAADPLLWVPAIPQPKLGYPIVGYTTIDLSQCYNNKAVGTAIINLLTDAYSVPAYETVITNNGFSPLASDGATGTNYIAGIVQDFLTNRSKFNLDIDDATVCSSYSGR